MQVKGNTLKFIAAGLVSALLFGSATPASKVLLGGVEAQVLAGLLYLGAGLGVLPVVLRERAFMWPWRAGRSTFLLLAGAIVLGGVLGPLLLLLGLRMTSSAVASLWLNLEFVITVILGHFVFREHLSLRGWFAASGTLIAAVLLAGGEGGGGIVPVFLIFSGCVCWGFDNHFTALIDGISPAQITLWKGFAAGVFNLFIGFIVTGKVGSLGLILGALLVGALSYGISITLYVVAAHGLGAIRSQMVFSAAPFFGLLLSVTLLGEAFTVFQVLAAGLIVVSLVVLLSEQHAHGHTHVAICHQHLHSHDGFHHKHEHGGKVTEKLTGKSHVHSHEHKPQEHVHKHLPDLHHRHGHGEE